MTPSHALNCWHCGKLLGSLNRKAHQTCAVVKDPLGNQHRVHKVCLRASVDTGNTLVRTHEEVAA